MIPFYDFEVFKYDWLVVIIDPFTKEETVIVNDYDQLMSYYEKHKMDVWCGYNNRHYDQYILKGILSKFDPFDVSKFIILDDNPGYKYSRLINKFPMINFDIALLGKSLKQLEGFQGHNIHESSVNFMIDRKLTQEEIEETIEYCRNDVLETINVFCECRSEFDALLGLVKMFNMPLSAMNYTKAQISAEILECESKKFKDDWDLVFLPCIKLSEYQWIKFWFENPDNQSENMELNTEVCGVPHTFGLGGLHGAVTQYHHVCRPNELMLHVDVASYYPSLMIFWNLLTRASKHPERFKEIYDLRLKLKREGKKKEQAPLKIVLNGTFGICKDKKSKAYDPRTASSICINGQLLLLDLLEKLESVPSFELIQSNTDGLIIKINAEDFEAVDDICYEWETRTKMTLEFDYIKEIFQKDVNNYLFVQLDGKIERKGSYVKELSSIDNDLPIINKALIEYMLHGVFPEETIGNCNDLIQFQKIVKLSSKYESVHHNGCWYTNKCYRVFASKNYEDGMIYKCKRVKKVIQDEMELGYPYVTNESYLKKDKFANTPDHCFIDNGDVTTKLVPEKLDKAWYVDLAYERLRQFGIEV